MKICLLLLSLLIAFSTLNNVDVDESPNLPDLPDSTDSFMPAENLPYKDLETHFQENKEAFIELRDYVLENNIDFEIFEYTYYNPGEYYVTPTNGTNEIYNCDAIISKMQALDVGKVRYTISNGAVEFTSNIFIDQSIMYCTSEPEESFVRIFFEIEPNWY